MRVAILLGAGSSRRFGRADKLMARLLGRPLLDHALDRSLTAGTRRVILVTGANRAQASRLARARHDRRLRIVHAATARDGLSASLSAGLRAVRPIERELLLFLADMPFAALPHHAFIPPGFQAARPTRRGMPGHPMLVRAAAARIVHMRGDRGLAARIGPVASLPADDGNLLDIDTPAALRQARRIAGPLRASIACKEQERRCWRR